MFFLFDLRFNHHLFPQWTRRVEIYLSNDLPFRLARLHSVNFLGRASKAIGDFGTRLSFCRIEIRSHQPRMQQFTMEAPNFLSFMSLPSIGQTES